MNAQNAGKRLRTRGFLFWWEYGPLESALSPWAAVIGWDFFVTKLRHNVFVTLKFPWRRHLFPTLVTVKAYVNFVSHFNGWVSFFVECTMLAKWQEWGQCILKTWRRWSHHMDGAGTKPTYTGNRRFIISQNCFINTRIENKCDSQGNKLFWKKWEDRTVKKRVTIRKSSVTWIFFV